MCTRAGSQVNIVEYSSKSRVFAGNTECSRRSMEDTYHHVVKRPVDSCFCFLHTAMKQRRNHNLGYPRFAPVRFDHVHHVSDGVSHVLDKHALRTSTRVGVLDGVNLINVRRRNEAIETIPQPHEY